MQTPIPAYKDRCLANRKGERWKDIPGLEGYFKISNQGRIKRLTYQTVYKNGLVITKKEMILKPYVHCQKNHYIGDYRCYLCIKLCVEGNKHHISISRLVYKLFVNKIDISQEGIVIFYKDNDYFNLSYKNLRPATLSEKQARIKKEKRSPSPLHKLPKNEIEERLLRAKEKLIKQVSQYDLMGKLLQSFESAAAAERSTGIRSSSIIQNARGNGFSAGGYVWRYGAVPFIDTSAIWNDPKIKHSSLNKKINMLTRPNNKIIVESHHRSAVVYQTSDIQV
jgi:hypothetical protein